MKILIADSDKENLGNIREILRLNLKRGTLNDYITVTDGKSALLEIILEKPDIIILDLNVPKLNAKKILQTLTELGNKQLLSLPVLIMSPKAGKDVFVELLKLGAKDFLVKPLDIESLIQKVEEVRKK